MRGEYQIIAIFRSKELGRTGSNQSDEDEEAILGGL
jgi:hypothetical protein